MVSFFSFSLFGGKKKSKSVDSDPSSTSSPQDTQPAPAIPAQPNTSPSPPEQTRPPAPRFLSLRSRSSSRYLESPKVLSRRASDAPSKPVELEFGLPQLDLGPELGTATGETTGEPNVLESSTYPTHLTDEEVALLLKSRYGLNEATAAWAVFGKALKETGCEQPGLMLPSRDEGAHYLLALHMSEVQPGLASSFPSISNRRSSDTLSAAAPITLCEALKFTLRRLRIASPPLFDNVLYTKFVQAECAAAYPLDAYDMLFRPRLPLGVGAYLNEVFEVLSAIATHAESNGMTAGKLCFLLGWWIWGYGVHAKPGMGWDKVYEQWKEAGRRVEHLFYAWIRLQSTTQQLSTRLLQLVETYPFGTATPSSEHLPTPPPYSFSRCTLHVTIESASQLSSQPEDLVAQLTHVDNKACPLLARLLERPGPWIDLISDQSFPSFQPSQSTSPHPDSHSPPDPRSQATPLSGPSTGRPRRPDPIITATPQTSNDQPSQSLSPNSAHTNPQVVDWADFEKAGFADSPTSLAKLDLSLSPSSVPLPLSPSSPHSPNSTVPLASPSSRPGSIAKSEEVIEIDDTFISFVQDAQSDPSTISWAPFALVRLARPIEHDSKPVELLLVSVTRPAPPPEILTRPSLRAASPSQTSTTSRRNPFGLRDLAGNIKRSPSLNGVGQSFRRAFSGTSRNLSQRSELEPLSEQAVLDLDAQPVDERAIARLGRSSDRSKKALTPSGSLATETRTEANERPGSNFDSVVDDWAYVAEGGAHWVFAYRGCEESYINHVLRIPKPSDHDKERTAHQDAKRIWRDELLPRLVPGDLPPSTREVTLDQAWVDDLITASASSRPNSRVDSDKGAQGAGGVVRAALMEDLRSSENSDGQLVLTIEIKPKWGFLPSSEHVHPPEAVPIKTTISRYRLHTHLRGGDDNYDPLDLFSGDEERLRTALEGLWGIWRTSGGEANNWRVALDGKQIRPDQADQIPGVIQTRSLPDRTAPLVIPLLQRSQVLQIIKSLQSGLDLTDISDLAARFSTQHPYRSIFDSASLPEPTPEELRDVVNLYLAQTGEHSSSFTYRQELIAYSLSAIFKDCSIFVKAVLKPSVGAGPDGYELVEEQSTVKIIDLDLKPLGNMRKWYELDEKIWRDWRDHPPTTTSRVNAEELKGLEEKGGEVSRHSTTETDGVPPQVQDESGATVTEGAPKGGSSTAGEQDDVRNQSE